jgi:hypothetical protein
MLFTHFQYLFHNAGITNAAIELPLEDLIEFGTLSDRDFRKLAMHIGSFEQSD